MESDERRRIVDMDLIVVALPILWCVLTAGLMRLCERLGIPEREDRP